MQAFTKKFNLQNCIYPFDIFYSLLPCLSFVTLFSFQGAIFRSLLKPDSKHRIFDTLNLNSTPALFNPNGRLVGPSGLEPPTSRLSVVRSNQLSYGPIIGGDNQIRTDDPLLAKQVLSQLSYTPAWSHVAD